MQNTTVKEQISGKSYNQEEWKQGYESQTGEHDYWIDNIKGNIPPELQGTFFRNGPGLLEIHGTPLQHPFDGDGMISAITFKNGKAHFRNRFVRTEAFEKEQEAGKMLYRGVFGSQKPGGWLANLFDLNIKNIANTNVIYWGGKLLALWEAAEPYRLNPSTLETMGIDYLDGVLEPKDAFAAHPWVDPSCEMDGGQPCLVNFSIQPGLSTKINVFEFAPSGELLRRHTHTVPGFAFIHDFAITPHYCIFFQNAVRFNPIPFMLGLQGAGECVKYQAHKPTRIILIPRTPPYEDVKVLETQAGFVFHHANAFELNDKTICLDSICYKSLTQVEPNRSYKEVDFDSLDPGQLWRFTMDLETETVQRELIESRCCEFPSINGDRVGRNYRYLYIGAGHNPTGNAPLQAILKLDLETGERKLWSNAPQGYVGEPIFVPKPNAMAEDEGWVLTMTYEGSHHRSDIVILDAQNLNMVARLHLNHHIPYGLHGSWTEECFV